MIRNKKQNKMKQYIKLTSLFLMMAFILSSCEDYLDIPPEADLTEDEVYGTYRNFQGFQDQIYKFVQDYNLHGARTTMTIGGEGLSDANHSSSMANTGDYWQLIGGNGENGYSPYVSNPSAGTAYSTGLYQNMWEAIRIANMTFEKLEEPDLLTDATANQRDWLKGQAFFYRGYFYYEFVRAFGTVPYVDTVLTAEEQDLKRHWTYEKNGKTYRDVQAVLERVVEDFEAASNLLPDVWESPNINHGRPTSLASLGFKAKALQFSASPLFNQQATGNANYDVELLDRCAAACVETIELAKSLVGIQPDGMPGVNADGLTPWDDFREVFATRGTKQPYTPEILFHRSHDRYGHNVYRAATARVFGARELSRQPGTQASQMYIDKFEMNDGSRYNIADDADTEKRTNQRDKRFRFNHYLTGDKVDRRYIDLGNVINKKDGTHNSNIIRKFYADNVTFQNYDGATYSTPLLRLADIYLTYAEAVFESTGSHTASAPGSSLTAEDAVNIVRSRAGQPDVATALPHYTQAQPNSCELDSDDPFRLLYRNERAVELAYEGVYWFDIRRWKRAHLKDGTQLTALAYDTKKNGSFFVVKEETITRVDKQQFIFKDAHYWMPFPTSMTRFSADWEQNPGW